MEKITEWNIQDYLKTKKRMAEYLRAALEENDFSYLKIAVGDVIKALETKKNQGRCLLKRLAAHQTKD